jgi:type IV secretory pathway TraG/TraD family ATPase VirD4
MPQQAITLLRQNRNLSSSVTRGTLPDVSISGNVVIGFFLGSIFIFIFPGLLFGGLVSIFFRDGVAVLSGLFFAIFMVLLFLFWPIAVILRKRYKTGEKPKDEILKTFHSGYDWLKKHIYKYELVEITNYTRDEEEKKKPIVVMKRNRDSSNFALWLGKSTGHLAKLWHPAGMAEYQNVALNLEDACQNILVLGGIGSGKTTCVMQPLLLQCLDQQCGGLIFDIKGDVKDAVKQFAASTNKDLVILGPNHTRMNLIEGLTPEVASSFLKSAFLLSDKRSVDSFWIDTATELCRNTLGMLSFLPNHYNLQNLHQYLFDLDTQEAINQELDNLLPSLPAKEARLLKTYCNYYDLIFAHFDSKIKSGVNATVAQALAPFNHPDLLDAFCLSDTSPAKMEDVLNGALYLVDMPLSVWGLGGKVAYTFIKLRFFNLMQNRNQTNHFNKSNPVFFMCDEYQEIVSASRDGLSDLNFWDKSRSSKTIGIISSQSIASFYAAIGSHDLAHALLQNFRQKLCLRTEDPVTLEFMERLIGRARVKKVADSYGGNEHRSKTITESREGVVDAQLFRELKPNNAVAILSLSGHSMDDVLNLMPVYVN